MWPKSHLPESCTYVGLDHYETAREWYRTIPNLYGDAMHLPIGDRSCDAVLLLDVLEHIEDTNQLLQQVHRILKAGGLLIITVPFLYPLHDEPRDFVRFTSYGFQQLADRHEYVIERCEAVGSPVTTSCVLLNISLAKTAVNWIGKRKLIAVTAVIFPFVVLAANLIAKILSRFECRDEFMPHSYSLLLRKKDQ